MNTQLSWEDVERARDFAQAQHAVASEMLAHIADERLVLIWLVAEARWYAESWRDASRDADMIWAFPWDRP